MKVMNLAGLSSINSLMLRSYRRAGQVGALLAALLLSGAAVAELVTIDRVVAVVNDDIIMDSEMRDRVRMVEYDLKQREGRVPPTSVLREQVLDRMIMETIQVQIAEQYGVRVSDQELNQAMGRIARDNGLSLEAFRYALQSDGLSYQDARAQIRREMLITQVRQRRVGDRVQVTPQELANFLRSDEGKAQTAAEYRIAHLLVPLSENPTPGEVTAAQRTANKIFDELGAGASFADVMDAIKAGGGPELKGGDLGWRKTDQLPTIFADAVPSLQAGQVAEPVKSASGFHIIKLMGVRGGEINFVKETNVRHILIRPSEIRSEQEARELIHDLRKKIRGGADFAELARAFSDDTNSARNGGDLGWVGAGATVAEFERVMENIVTGELSQPFKSPFGWHVLQVIERRDTDKSDEFRTRQATNILRSRKFEEALTSWLAEIREEAFVDIKI